MKARDLERTASGVVRSGMDRIGVAHYRELAADARVAAEKTRNVFLRAQFQQLAETYDELALQLERWEAKMAG